MPSHRLELDEADRQMVLLALAALSMERPGFDATLNRIALRIDDTLDGRAELYDELRALRRDPNVIEKARKARDAKREGRTK